jgi:hypothetical protein
MRIKTFKLVSDAPSDPTKMDTHSIAPWLLLCSPLLVVQISHLGSFIYILYTHDVRQAFETTTRHIILSRWVLFFFSTLNRPLRPRAEEEEV